MTPGALSAIEHKESIKLVLFICCSYQCGYGPQHNTGKIPSSSGSTLIPSIGLPKALAVFLVFICPHAFPVLVCLSSANISFVLTEANEVQRKPTLLC